MWGDHYSTGELSVPNLGFYTVPQYVLAPCKFIHKICPFIFSFANAVKQFPLPWNAATAVSSGGSWDEKFSAVRLWQTSFGKLSIAHHCLHLSHGTGKVSWRQNKNEMIAEIINTLFSVSLSHTNKVPPPWVSRLQQFMWANGAICLTYFQKWTKAWIMSSP